MLKIKEITATKTHALRIKILRKGIAQNYIFKEDYSPSSFHLGAFTEAKCIGIASFIEKEHPHFGYKKSYQLRGMAIEQNQQKKGIGKQLLEKSIAILQEKKTKILWCNAREVAVSFYKKQDFSIVGKAFDIPTIGMHYLMYKKI